MMHGSHRAGAFVSPRWVRLEVRLIAGWIKGHDMELGLLILENKAAKLHVRKESHSKYESSQLLVSGVRQEEVISWRGIIVKHKYE